MAIDPGFSLSYEAVAAGAALAGVIGALIKSVRDKALADAQSNENARRIDSMGKEIGELRSEMKGFVTHEVTQALETRIISNLSGLSSRVEAGFIQLGNRIDAAILGVRRGPGE